LDIVQDSMMKLSEKYSGQPAEELPMLFQRILQNTIRDHYRRQKVRSIWTTLLSALLPNRDEDDHNPLETLEFEDESSSGEPPAKKVERMQLLDIIENELHKLPIRQREAFL
jgi:RNA polymerase sigma-70 factor (ECF subfamily)